MIHARIDDERAIPFWAAIGAPLVGVPLMVALLALAAPSKEAAVVPLDMGVSTEQVEVQQVDQLIDRCDDDAGTALKQG